MSLVYPLPSRSLAYSDELKGRVPRLMSRSRGHRQYHCHAIAFALLFV